MKKIIIVLILSVLFVTGCSIKLKNEPDTIKVVDLIGMESEIKPGNYERVICVGAGALRLYTYICGSDNLAGVEDIENYTLSQRPKMFDGSPRPYYIRYKEEFSKLPSCGVGGPNMQIAEAEKILNCNPDIIISEYSDTTIATALKEQVGVPVITLSYGNQGVFDDRLKQSLLLLGKIFDKDARANELVNYIDNQKEELNQLTKDIEESEKPNVYICGLGNWGTTNHLMTSGNYAPFNVSNIKNICADLGINGVQKIEEEKFISLGENMDIVIIDAAAIKNIKALYQNDPTMFDTIKAFQNGETYLEMAYNVYYTNVELALINAWFAAFIVYPSIFADFDISDKTSEVTLKFLGQDLKDEIFNSPQSYGGYQKIDINQLLK